MSHRYRTMLTALVVSGLTVLPCHVVADQAPSRIPSSATVYQYTIAAMYIQPSTTPHTCRETFATKATNFLGIGMNIADAPLRIIIDPSQPTRVALGGYTIRKFHPSITLWLGIGMDIEPRNDATSRQLVTQQPAILSFVDSNPILAKMVGTIPTTFSMSGVFTPQKINGYLVLQAGSKPGEMPFCPLAYVIDGKKSEVKTSRASDFQEGGIKTH